MHFKQKIYESKFKSNHTLSKHMKMEFGLDVIKFKSSIVL